MLAVFFAITLFLFAACGNEVIEVTSAERLYALENEGILTMAYAMEEAATQNFNLYTARRDDIVMTAIVNLRAHFPVFEYLAFERTDGYFNELLVTNGQFVREGDILATLDFDTEELEISYNHAVFQLNMFEEIFRDLNRQIVTDIAIKRDNYNNAEGQDWVQYALELARLELSHAQFLMDSDVTRQKYIDQVQELRDEFATGVITAPFDGVIHGARNILQGNSVSGRIMTILDVNYIHFVMSSSMHYVFRFGDILTASTTIETDYETITFYFDLKVVTDAFIGGQPPGRFEYILVALDSDSLIDFIKRLDKSYLDLLDMNFTIRDEIPRATDAVVVHRRAVTTGDEASFVLIYEDGDISRRYVTVGEAVGDEVQILSGLDAGQRVVRF